MSFNTPIVPERWDRGKWDSANWDGQLGQTTGTLAVTVTAQTASLVTTHRYTLTAAPLPILIITSTADLIITSAGDQVLTATPLSITVTTSLASLDLEGEVPPLPTLPPPGIIRMGRPAYIPGRW